MTDVVGPMRRLSKELRDMPKNESKYWTLSPVDDSLRSWAGEIHKLDDKRHRCRKYRLTIDVPESYPFKPPVVKFIDRIRCENVYEDGGLCIDILGPMWSPSFTLPLLMEAIVSVLTDAPVTGLINKPVPVATSVVRPLHLLNSRSNSTVEMPAYGTPEFWRWAKERKEQRSNQNIPEYRNILVRT